MFGQTVDVRTTLTGKSYYIALALEERKRGERRGNINTKLTNGKRENGKKRYSPKATNHKEKKKQNKKKTTKQITQEQGKKSLLLLLGGGGCFDRLDPPPPYIIYQDEPLNLKKKSLLTKFYTPLVVFLPHLYLFA